MNDESDHGAPRKTVHLKAATAVSVVIPTLLTAERSAPQKKVVNERLLAKLEARGETLEERKARRSQKRAAHIAAKFGYTAESNPFNDPNLHEAFTWKKREEKKGPSEKVGKKKPDKSFQEIEKVRKRRKEREIEYKERERQRADESRLKELEKYDEWAAKEEEFHLQQQRQRSAIRLVEGREKPVDVLAKNILLFGLTDDEKKTRSKVKYQEKYNALDAMEALEAELEEPQKLLKMLKTDELEDLRIDIDVFRRLEREASALQNGTGDNIVLRYWDNLRVVAQDEINFLKSGGSKGTRAKMVEDVGKIFACQPVSDLVKMKDDVDEKLRKFASVASFDGGEFDRDYWILVSEQLLVHLAKTELSELHSKMLVRQLERLEKRREELANKQAAGDSKRLPVEPEKNSALPENVEPDFGNAEEELGHAGEVDVDCKTYSWQDKYRPRKPRYFNRVKTGYDWNAYNKIHYDRDNPPPKIVQGYKFNIFYPDLIDPTKTPQFVLEPTTSDEFCIIRFRAGPPYEDVAFKIVNREWNRSRKRGFKCTFERGVLSLYFNFTTHWYRK